MKLSLFMLASLIFFGLAITTVHATLYNLTPVDDSYIRNQAPNNNYGYDEGIIVRFNEADTYWALLKFDLSGYGAGNLTKVSLRLHNQSAGGSEGLGANTTHNCVWSESTVTYNTKCNYDFSLQYQTGNAGGFNYWNSTIGENFYNYTVDSMGGSLNLIIDTNSIFFGNYTSKEGALTYGNISFFPTLILDYNGTAGAIPSPPPPATTVSPVNITLVTYPHPFATLDATYLITVGVHNIGNFTSTYKIGFSIGSDGIYCNAACYVGGYVDNYTMTKWLGAVTINPDETGFVSLPFTFRSDVFTVGTSYDVRVTVRPVANLSILDNVTYPNAVIPVFFNTTASSAKIINVTLSDYNPTIDETITATIRVMNNGTTAGEFPVGFSIGADGIYCNRDCYQDCFSPPHPAQPSPYFCDYASTGFIHPNQSVTITRSFKFNSNVFQEGKTYDVLATISYFPYSSPLQQYDRQIYSDAVNISTVVNKLRAYATNAVATPDHVQIRNLTMNEDVLSVDFYVINNGTLTYNYTIGASIGLWAVNTTGTYTTTQSSLVPPCDTFCYTDDLGSWVYALIPPTFAAPIHREIRVPHYLLENNSFDLAVGIWTTPDYVYPYVVSPQLVSVTYFKGIGFIDLPRARTVYPNIAQAGANVVGGFLGIRTDFAFMLIALLISIIVGIYAGIKSHDGLTAAIVILCMLFAFILIGWIPIWVLIILGVLTAFLIANFFRKMMTPA
jgi:hypothetical protein